MVSVHGRWCGDVKPCVSIPRYLKIFSVYTNSFCRHNTGRVVLMYTASNRLSWNELRAVAKILNLSSLYLAAHCSFCIRCWPMAESHSGLVLWRLQDRSGWLRWDVAPFCRIHLGTCCLMRSWRRCDVLPTYLLSQWHENWYMTELLSVLFKAVTKLKIIWTQLKITPQIVN